MLDYDKHSLEMDRKLGVQRAGRLVPGDVVYVRRGFDTYTKKKFHHVAMVVSRSEPFLSRRYSSSEPDWQVCIWFLTMSTSDGVREQLMFQEEYRHDRTLELVFK
jgi:hypothetical protein